jgi:hypothetical protein
MLKRAWGAPFARMTAIVFPRISETGHQACTPRTLCPRFSQAAARLYNWTMVLAMPRFWRHVGQGTHHFFGDVSNPHFGIGRYPRPIDPLSCLWFDEGADGNSCERCSGRTSPPADAVSRLESSMNAVQVDPAGGVRHSIGRRSESVRGSWPSVPFLHSSLRKKAAPAFFFVGKGGSHHCKGRKDRAPSVVVRFGQRQRVDYLPGMNTEEPESAHENC